MSLPWKLWRSLRPWHKKVLVSILLYTQDIQTWLCVTIAHFTASSRSRQDEPFPVSTVIGSVSAHKHTAIFDLTLGQSIMHMSSFWNFQLFTLALQHLRHIALWAGSPWCVSRFSFLVKKNNSTHCVLYVMDQCYHCYNTNANIKTTRNIFFQLPTKLLFKILFKWVVVHLWLAEWETISLINYISIYPTLLVVPGLIIMSLK